MKPLLLTANETQDMPKVYQAVGWLLGYWSAETNYRGDVFTDIVEQAGGQAIIVQTLAECRKFPKDTKLYDLANSMIGNTG